MLNALLIVCAVIQAQVAPDKYWVQFTDKNNSPYSIDNPEEFLSKRSIQRRINYGISIDEKDIPVNPSYLKAVEDAGATILNPSKWLNGVTIETTNQKVIDVVENLPFVKKIRILQDEPLKQMLKSKSFLYEANINNVVSNKNGRNHYGSALAQIELLNGVELHEMGYQGEGIWIGICDSGYEGVDTHDVFNNMREENRLLGTRDVV